MLVSFFSRTKIVFTQLHASSDAGRELGASVLTYLGLIQLAKRSGIGCLDFNGANSPTRADYKHSWAAEPAIFLTYRLRYESEGTNGFQ